MNAQLIRECKIFMLFGKAVYNAFFALSLEVGSWFTKLSLLRKRHSISIFLDRFDPQESNDKIQSD